MPKNAKLDSVLVIDDEPGMRQMLGEMFQAQKISSVDLVESAEDAFKLLDSKSYSLIVCDYRLPGMNGVTFLGKLRISGDMTPLLLISGIPDKTPAISAASQAKVDFLAKPFTATALTAVIGKLATP